jgi:flavin reductase (DIM6/NTAB) family NADH-FMN oxidoreductase RutF
MSRKNFGAKPLMYPQPVLIIGTYDENGVPNAMNAAWGITTDFKEISISLSDHKTTDNLKVKNAFTVSMATEDQAVACDYVGVVSGRKNPDKFKQANFHATKSEFVDAPLIDELPLALECKVKSFEDGILIGEIVNVSADESVLTDGQLDIRKLKPISFNPFDNKYYGVGEEVGHAFKDGLTLRER